MSPRAAVQDRCSECGLRQILCLCADVPRLQISTELILVMHIREAILTSNTARLAKLILSPSILCVRGLHEADRAQREGGTRAWESSPGVNKSDRRLLILYPSEDAETLTPEWKLKNPGPYRLVVPDGSWRQASKVRKRERGLMDATPVKLAPGPPSRYRLRSEPDDESLCTFEALTRALEVLEAAPPEWRRRMEEAFEIHVERVLFSRGQLQPHEATTRLPEAALMESKIAGPRGRKV